MSYLKTVDNCGTCEMLIYQTAPFYPREIDYCYQCSVSHSCITDDRVLEPTNELTRAYDTSEIVSCKSHLCNKLL